jgi:predicted metal-dependent hydrolase
MSERSVVVGRDGRAKAYRPLPAADRVRALAAGLEAYGRGDFFEAHELLEPAWMGTDVPSERALLQGLIKLAAAYVHAVRGNPAGVVRNLEGALMRLRESDDDRLAAGLPEPWLDLPGLVAALEDRLADLAAHPAGATLPPPALPLLPEASAVPWPP